MISKNEAKYIQSLSQKKQRDISGHFIAEGVKLVEELFGSEIEIEKIYAVDDWQGIGSKVDRVDRVYKVDKVSEEELGRISLLQTPNKVLAVVKMPKYDFTGIASDGWSMVLDGIQDPGNMGTLIRIADWFGVKEIIASVDSVDAYNPKVVQATMGSIARIKIYYTNIAKALTSCNKPIYGALLEGKKMHDYPSIKDGVLMIGNESKGISKQLIDRITHKITIPRIGEAESLNAAVAAGILLSHLTKRA